MHTMTPIEEFALLCIAVISGTVIAFGISILLWS
jgi:hypothetical protein